MWLNTDIRPKLGVTLHFFYQFNGTLKHENLPLWIFTSKQIHDEALAQWYRGASCSPCFCGPEHGKTNPTKLTVELCDIWRVQSLVGPVLNTPREADGDHELWTSEKRTTVRNAHPNDTPHKQNGSSRTVLVPRMSEHLVPYLVTDCFFKFIQENKNLPAKEIKLPITAQDANHTKGYTSVDLSFFELLGPRFDRVVFQIACPDFRQDVAEGIYPRPEPYPWIQREAVRVAKYLVSRDGSTGWKLRDYFQPMNESLMFTDFAWCVEVTRQMTQESGELLYEGLQKYRILSSSGSGGEAEEETEDDSVYDSEDDDLSDSQDDSEDEAMANAPEEATTQECAMA
jgi:hypothetical protein